MESAVSKLDLFLMQDVPYPDFIEMAQLAEEHGFEDLWLIDGQDVFPDPWTTAALCAVNTSRIRIGPGVTNPLTRHPRVTANAMLTVHELSGGRGVLGLGAGDNAVRTMGWKPASVSVMREAVEICREKFKRNSAEIPIYIAAGGPRMTAYALSAADGIIVAGGGTPQDLRRVVGRVEAGAKETGRDMTAVPVFYTLGFAISHDRQEALDDARGAIARLVRDFVDGSQSYPPELENLRSEVERVAGAYDYASHLKSHVPHSRMVSDALVEAYGLAGTPQEVTPKFKALWREAAGLDLTFYLRADGRGKKRSFELFVREVLPELR
jgi:5,10-methylenetetrahydromethanopterin reductase